MSVYASLKWAGVILQNREPLTEIDFTIQRYQINLKSVVRPTSKLQGTVLGIKWKEFDIHSTFGTEDRRCQPFHGTVMGHNDSVVELIQTSTERFVLVHTGMEKTRQNE